MSKIIVGIYASTKEEAIERCRTITKIDEGYCTSGSSVILELPFCLFVMIPKSSNFCGRRVHYVYATKEEIKTDLFQNVVMPMFSYGLGIVEN